MPMLYYKCGRKQHQYLFLIMTKLSGRILKALLNGEGKEIKKNAFAYGYCCLSKSQICNPLNSRQLFVVYCYVLKGK